MNKQLLRFTLYATIIYLISSTLDPAIAGTRPSGANGIHASGVIDEQPNKQHSDQFPNRNYTQTSAENLNVADPRTVRLIYFLPNDRPYRADVVQRMKDEILSIQTFYAEQMQAHGYGFTTFRVETDSEGEPMVHRVDGLHPDSYYVDDALRHALPQIDQTFNREENIYLIVIDNSMHRINIGTRCPRGVGGRRSKHGGYASVSGRISTGYRRT